MRETMRTDAAAIGSRWRLELGVITVVAGAFGAAMLVAAADRAEGGQRGQAYSAAFATAAYGTGRDGAVRTWVA